jgi:ATP-binding cassette subfamily B protein
MAGKKDKKATAWIKEQARSQRARLCLLVFLGVFVSASTVAFALLSKTFLDRALAGEGAAISIAAVMAVIVVLQAAARICSGALSESTFGKLDVKIKNGVFTSLMTKKQKDLSAYHTGELLNRIFSDAEVVADGIVSIIPNVVSAAARLAAALVALALLDLRFVAVFAAAGLFVFGVSRVMRGMIKKRHKKMQEAKGRVRSFMQEAVDRLLVIKIFGGAKRTGEKALAKQKEYFGAFMKKALLSVSVSAGFLFVFRAAYLGVLVYCGFSMAKGVGAVTVGTLAAMLQLVSQVQQPAVSLSGVTPRYYAVTASAERICELLYMPDEREKAPADEIAREFELSDGICVENVTANYGRGEVLKGASAFIKKNSFTLINGRTGSGKSTLFMLLLGVYGHGGSIRLSSGRELDETTRGLFAFVPQGNLLFSGSVRENLCLSREVPDEKLNEALETACAYDFVSELPQGLDTEIGEHGRALSEGQAQRIATARALISDAPVLLLDESTSALDAKTEEKLLSNLRGLKNRTVLLISHREAARRLCDVELTVEDGLISERKGPQK